MTTGSPTKRRPSPTWLGLILTACSSPATLGGGSGESLPAGLSAVSAPTVSAPPGSDISLAGTATGPSALDRAGEAPINPWSADPVWGQFHRNGYAQAATTARGPEAGDRLQVQYVAVPGSGGAPTQMHLSAPYPDGSRTAWSTTLTHIVKARVRGATFELAGAYEIAALRELNVAWNMTLGRGNKAYVPSPRDRAILRFGDADPRDPRSPIVLEKTFRLPPEVRGVPAVLNLSYDGWLVVITNEAWMVAVKTDFSAHRSFDLGQATNDLSTHNSFPMDEQGNLYVASLFAMTKVRWTGNEFRLVWRTPYDFRGPGCPPVSGKQVREALKVVAGLPCTGSGTTPTLVGRGAMDQLVVAVDSHRRNRLVAFWRNEPPADWVALPGQDRRVAGVLELPHSTWAGRGFTAENSPPVSGYDIAVAQYAGFTPPCDAPRGVQLARWNPALRKLELTWANDSVPFNNVMTLSSGSGLIYGSGRNRDCQVVYRGLERHTGRVAFSLPLGRSDRFVDSGNTNALLDDRSILFGVPQGIARLRPVGP
ncbi:hypothetical protein [Deinococcus koreensis]|uniref:Uncharacterized protein n=1 Tax=Deinococcus koreensis TaxID=2054903 RepID=A0A2K3UUE4_9DEIO|nr:hypothetical protein [Deinococcus koreensis]PNY80152.1 hypothetical protein CVO96_01195 [Deinococcus koreensis]